MAATDAPVAPLRPRRYRWLPFGDPSRGRRLVKVLAWLAGTALLVAALELLGVDVAGWLSSMWDAVTGIGLGYLVAGWSLCTSTCSRPCRARSSASSSCRTTIPS